MAGFVSSAPFDDRISDRVKVQVNHILNKSRLDNADRVGDVYLLGKGERRAPTAQEQQELNMRGIHCDNVIEYQRAFHANIEFRSTKYTVPGRSDNTHIFTWDGRYALVKSILVFQPNGQEQQVCGMICRVFNSLRRDPILTYMVRVMRNNNLPLDCVPFPSVRSLVVKNAYPGRFYLARIHNHIDID